MVPLPSTCRPPILRPRPRAVNAPEGRRPICGVRRRDRTASATRRDRRVDPGAGKSYTFGHHNEHNRTSARRHHRHGDAESARRHPRGLLRQPRRRRLRCAHLEFPRPRAGGQQGWRRPRSLRFPGRPRQARAEDEPSAVQEGSEGLPEHHLLEQDGLLLRPVGVHRRRPPGGGNGPVPGELSRCRAQPQLSSQSRQRSALRRGAGLHRPAHRGGGDRSQHSGADLGAPGDQGPDLHPGRGLREREYRAARRHARHRHRRVRSVGDHRAGL